MRIGMDVYSFDKPNQNFGVGPGVYAWNLLAEMIAQCPDDEFVVFANAETASLVPSQKNVTVVVSKLPTRYRILRVLHEQIMIPFWCAGKRLDVIHYLGNNISFLLRKISVLTVHDLMFKYYADRGEKSLRYRYANYIIPKSISYSKAVVTASSFVANELAELKLRDNGIFTVQLAAGDIPALNHSEVTPGTRTLSQGEYVYSVTTSMPHKNLMMLLSAFSELLKTDDSGVRLVVSGQLKGDSARSAQQFISVNGLDERIILTGFVSENDKAWLYTHAAAFVYPSLYEGFGLPILEAMTYDVPVLASNAASIPEVGGEACLYFNPTSIDELSNAMNRILKDNILRAKMIAKGREQCARFSWKDTARQTRIVYNRSVALA